MTGEKYVKDYFEILEGSDTRFLIKNGGNVGIGTNAPAHKLDVSGSAIHRLERFAASKINRRAGGCSSQ